MPRRENSEQIQNSGVQRACDSPATYLKAVQSVDTDDKERANTDSAAVGANKAEWVRPEEETSMR